MLIFLFVSGYAAAEDNPFKVIGLEVYAEAESLDEATSLAIEDGKRRASKVLFARVLPSTLQWKVDQLNLSMLDSYLVDYHVTWERMTSISYRAIVNYTFNDNKIKDFLNSSGVVYGSKYEPKTLVIQFDENDDIVALNDLERVESLAFEKNFGLSKFALLAGDLQDEDLTGVIYFSTAEFNLFAPLLNRYQAEQAAIVKNVKVGGKNILLVRIITPKSNRIIYKVISDSELSFAGLIAQSMIDDSYKGVKTCVPVKKYFANIIPDLATLKVLQAMNECVDLKMKKGSYEIRFSERPEVFSKVLLAAGVKIDKSGKATLSLPELPSNLSEKPKH